MSHCAGGIWARRGGWLCRMAAGLSALLLAQACGSSIVQRRADDTYEDETPTNAVYGELFGNGLLLTLNYEKIIDGKIFARFGAFCVPDKTVACPFTAPIMVGYFLGRGHNKLELGIGQLWIWNQPLQGWTIAQTATIGWRYQPSRPGMMWKVAWTPILGAGPGQNESAPIWLGVASGFTW